MIIEKNKFVYKIPKLIGLPSKTEIEEAKGVNKPNTLFLSVGGQCNLNCIYCYTVPKRLRPDRPILSLKQQKQVIDEAVKIGIKYLVIPGPGEPLLYEHIEELINYATNRQIWTTIFTNGTIIDQKNIQVFKKLKLSFIVKLNSFDIDLQNKLIGKNKAHKIYDALEILLRNAFNKGNYTRLGIDCLICKYAINEITDIVEWAFENKIFPIVERLLPAGRAIDNYEALEVDDEDAIKLIRDLNKMVDHSSQNYFSGGVCNLHEHTIFFDVDGIATRCVGGRREIKVGEWPKSSLAKIWENILRINQMDEEKQFINNCIKNNMCPGRLYCKNKNKITGMCL